MTTPQTPRWYSVNNMGMATLCANQADAEKVASDCNIQWPRQAPHRAVQLVEVSGCGIGRDEIMSMARAAGFEGEFRRNNTDELEKFAKLAITRHIAHRPPAPIVVKMSDVDQAQLAAMLDKRQLMPLVAAPGDSELASVSEAVANEREACAVVCEGMHEEDRPSDYAYAIRARGAT